MSRANAEFWFEYGSTYTYVTVARIDSISAARNVVVDWRPFLLMPIVIEQEWTEAHSCLTRTSCTICAVISSEGRSDCRFGCSGEIGADFGPTTACCLSGVPLTGLNRWRGRSTGRGRDEDCSPPPAQIPASAANAPGSCLGW